MQYRQVAKIKLAKIKLQPSIPKWRTYKDTKIRYREIVCPNDVWSYVEAKFTFKYNVYNVVLRKERKVTVEELDAELSFLLSGK